MASKSFIVKGLRQPITVVYWDCIDNTGDCTMTENNSKPVTKIVTLKVTYNSFFMEPPDTWDWNQLIDSAPDENVEVISVSDNLS